MPIESMKTRNLETLNWKPRDKAEEDALEQQSISETQKVALMALKHEANSRFEQLILNHLRGREEMEATRSATND